MLGISYVLAARAAANAQKQYIGYLKAKTRREYLASLPRYKGKSIVPKVKKPATISGAGKSRG
jgi:hypothetical protein